MKGNLTYVRLQKEEQKLLKNPLSNAVIRRKGALNFHFCIFDLDGDYTGGYYHGVLELPEDYPFSPPKLKFYTPSGRFETDTPICTTFTNFHKETWSTAWNVESMVLATISFMQSEENAAGAKVCSSAERRRYASESMGNNIKNTDFTDLFIGENFVKAYIEANRQSKLEKPSLQKQPNAPTNSYIPMVCLAMLVVGYIYLKLS